MKIKDLLIERRIQKTQIMYHGTSSKNVPSILKHGLLANPPAATYSADSDNEHEDVGYHTFKGGVYITNNKRIALSGANAATDEYGGRPVLVTVQYVISSGQIDEDDIYSTITQSLVASTKGKVKTVADAARYFSNPSNAQQVINNAVRHFKDKSELDFSKYSFTPGKFIMKRGTDALIAKLASLFINETVANGVKNAETWPFDEYITWDALNALRYNPEYESTIYKLLSVMKPTDSPNIRVARDIKFSGKTRILDIRNMETNDVYYSETAQEKV